LTDPKVIKITSALKQDPHEPPAVFYQRVKAIIEDGMDFKPQGQTPLFECLQESFARQHHQGTKKVVRVLFSDGRPDGEQRAIKGITDLLQNRRDPQDNPVTFLSVTDDPKDTEWISEVEEAAPFCAEVSNYKQESREIASEQGKSFPVTRGFCIISALVGALCPEDIDILDEGICLPKSVLNELQGYVCSDDEYKWYFNEFLEAQLKKANETLKHNPKDKIASLKREFATSQWPNHYEEFRTRSSLKDIPVVREFREAAKNPQAWKTKNNNNNTQQQPQQTSYSSYNQKQQQTASSQPAVAAPTSNYQKMEEDRSTTTKQQTKSKDGCPCVVQ
jgi:hypothetical protein